MDLNPESKKNKSLSSPWLLVAGLLIIPGISGGFIAWEIGEHVASLPEAIGIAVALLPVIISSFIVIPLAYKNVSMGKRFLIGLLYSPLCFISYVAFLFGGCIANFDIH